MSVISTQHEGLASKFSVPGQDSKELSLGFFGRRIKNKKNLKLIKEEYGEKWSGYSEKVRDSIASKMLFLKKKQGEGFEATKLSRRVIPKEFADSSLLIRSDGTVIALLHSKYPGLEKKSNVIGSGGEKRVKATQGHLVLAVYRKDKYRSEKQKKKIERAIPLFEKYKGIPGFVQYHACTWKSATHGKSRYAVLSERCAGSLKQYESHAKLSIIFKLMLSVQAAEALASMHARGDVHFDIKLENIFIKENMSQNIIENLMLNLDDQDHQSLFKLLKRPPFEALIADYDSSVSFKNKNSLIDLRTVIFTRRYASAAFLSARSRREFFTKEQAMAYDVESFARILFEFFGFKNLDSDSSSSTNMEKNRKIRNFYQSNMSFNIKDNPIARFIWEIGFVKNEHGQLYKGKRRSMKGVAEGLEKLLKDPSIFELSKKC